MTMDSSTTALNFIDMHLSNIQLDSIFKLRDSMEYHPCLQNLNEIELQKLQCISQRLHLKPGQYLVHQDESLDCIYLIVSGELSVLKYDGDHKAQITTLRGQEVVGEINFFDRQKSSASIKALAHTEVIRIHLNDLDEPTYKDIKASLSAFFVQVIASKIRTTNHSMHQTDHQFKVEQQLRSNTVIFFVILLYVVLTYTLFVPLLIEINKAATATTFLSIILMFMIIMSLSYLISQMGQSIDHYGFKPSGNLHDIVEAVILTLPLMIFFTVIKWVVLQLGDFPNQPLIGWSNGYKFFIDRSSQSDVFNLYLFSVILYVLFCPIQEIIHRGIIQSWLHQLIGSKYLSAPVILSTLISSASHAHYGIEFTITSLIPCLFWSWLYAKQRNVLSVSISHIIFGLWLLHLLGLVIPHS